MSFWEASSWVKTVVSLRCEGVGHRKAGSVMAQAFKVSGAVLAGSMLMRLQDFVIFL